MNKKIVSVLVVLAAIVAAYFFIRKGSSGPLKEDVVIKGSDTEVQMVSNLAEAFLEKNKGVNVSVTGGGSGVGIASLLNKEITIANSSRKMKDDELAMAKSKNLDIQEFIVARDGLSIIVHPGNQVKKLSLDQLGKIYKGVITNWREVGGKDARIVLYGRQSTSGTYVFFRDSVLMGDYSAHMLNMEGNQSIVDAVKADVNGVGYVGVGYVVDKEDKPRTDVRVLNIENLKGVAVSPLDKEAVGRGDYPISRPIFQYLANLPKKGSALDNFLNFEFSSEGQKIVESSGFYLLTAQDQEQDRILFGKIK